MTPQPQYLAGESLVSVFDGTGNVAVADVTNPRAQWFDYEGATISCGFAYTAEVIESLSGDGKTFEFIIPTFQPPKKAVAPGRYLVFTNRNPRLPEGAAPRSAFEHCLDRLDYYTSFDLEMLYPIALGTGDRKFRGPSQDDSILHVFEIGACDVDAQGLLFCVDDVREGIRKIHED